MNDKTSNYGWWPDVRTLSSARSARMYGVWAAIFSATVTALLASWSLISETTVFGFVNAWAFIDVLIFAAVAFGIYRESRFAAVAGLAIFVGEKLYQMSVSTTTSGGVMALILSMCYVASIRGNYSLHRLQTPPPTAPSQISSELAKSKSTDDLAAELERLQKLHEQKLPTDEEYEA